MSDNGYFGDFAYKRTTISPIVFGNSMGASNREVLNSDPCTRIFRMEESFKANMSDDLLPIVKISIFGKDVNGISLAVHIL